jgi:hypothetical protein
VISRASPCPILRQERELKKISPAINAAIRQVAVRMLICCVRQVQQKGNQGKS